MRGVDAVLAALAEQGTGSPDSPAPVDATDRLLLSEAATTIAATRSTHVAVIDDRMGALTLGAAQLARPSTPADGAPDLPGDKTGHRPNEPTSGPVRVHQDLVTAERTLAAGAARLGLDGTYAPAMLGPELLAGTRVVLAVLPRSLAALREIAQIVATYAEPDVVLFAGGRVKHMTHSMNDVLADSFADVRASLASSKSRVLIARGVARRQTIEFPAASMLSELDLCVRAHGAAFAGTRLDLGTRALLNALEAALPAHVSGPASVVDLGCGTGLLAAWAARRWPHASVVAADASWAAVASAAATATANGLTVTTVRDDAGDSLPATSVDVVLCNPPFHEGPAVRTDVARRMFVSAGRLLRPGGRLYCVWNSHLRYRSVLEREVGATEQLARDRRFTVTVSTRGR